MAPACGRRSAWRWGGGGGVRGGTGVGGGGGGGGGAGGGGGGGGVGFTVVVHCRPKARRVAIRAAGAGWTRPRAGGNILMPSVERSPFHHQALCPRTRLAPPRSPSTGCTSRTGPV